MNQEFESPRYQVQVEVPVSLLQPDSEIDKYLQDTAAVLPYSGSLFSIIGLSMAFELEGNFLENNYGNFNLNFESQAQAEENFLENNNGNLHHALAHQNDLDPSQMPVQMMNKHVG
jgi:hypothetical protein